MDHRVTLLPKNEELVPESDSHRFDPQMARRGRMLGWLGSKKFVNMLCPEDGDTSTKKLVPPDGFLGVDQIVELRRKLGGRQGGAGHPVFETGHEDIQDDIVVFGAEEADRSEMA
jgi:hypothetical protein